MLKKILLAALLCSLSFLLTASAADAPDDPTIVIHTGKVFVWYTKQSIWDAHQQDITLMFDYMDNEFAQIVKDYGVTPPRQQYSLWVNPQTGGGYATGDIPDVHAFTHKTSPGIAIAYDAYFGSAHNIKQFWAYALGTHESVNLFTLDALSPGWPRDWWADDKSPFPAMTAVRVEAELSMTDVSAAHDASFHHDKIYAMMKAIQAKFGWTIFRNAFAMVKQDGIRWDNLDHGYNPSAILTGYVTAYLVMGSGDTLDNMSADFFAKGIPGFNPAMTAQVIAAHEIWKKQNTPEQAKAFLSGHYLSVGGFPDFKISNPTPSTLCVAPGQSTSTDFEFSNAQPADVTFAVTGLPPGVTAIFSQPAPDHRRLTLTADPAAASCAATLKITGDAKGVSLSASHGFTIPLIVSPTAQTAVNLAPFASLYAVGNDHLVLGDNGGIDGSGFAYSGILLGPCQSYAGTQFAIPLSADGTQGTYNAVAAGGIPLSLGKYQSLRMLACAHGGPERDVPFIIQYTDHTKATFHQSLSDWTDPQNFPGETAVLTMPYCDKNLTTLHANRTLYGYTFALDPNKTVAGFSLTGRNAWRSHIAVIAITLVP